MNKKAGLPFLIGSPAIIALYPVLTRDFATLSRWYALDDQATLSPDSRTTGTSMSMTLDKISGEFTAA